MKVNSFFCGAGGFDLGFIQAGFEIVGAWDFDKYAVQSYNHNIGGAEQADVSLMKGQDLKKADGWLFGFPCQDISVAGKQKGMIKGETRSGLFYEIMRLLDEVSDKPEWILAENVKAVKKFIPEIREEYDKAGYRLVYPQLYNSKYWWVPQNRERYFLLGIRKDVSEMLFEMVNGQLVSKSFQFPEQQTDFIPKLSSVLESEVDEKFYIDDLKAAKIIEQAIEGLKVKQATNVGIASRGRYNENGKVEQNYEMNKEGITNTLTSVQKDNYLVEQPKIEMLGLLDMKGNETVRRVYDVEGLSPTLTTSEGGHRQPKILVDDTYGFDDYRFYEEISPTLRSSRQGLKTMDNCRVRKLTPREYARLQGFPDTYKQIVSNSQFYKQMGNAVTVNVAHAIATAIKEQL